MYLHASDGTFRPRQADFEPKSTGHNVITIATDKDKPRCWAFSIKFENDGHCKREARFAVLSRYSTARKRGVFDISNTLVGPGGENLDEWAQGAGFKNGKDLKAKLHNFLIAWDLRKQKQKAKSAKVIIARPTGAEIANVGDVKVVQSSVPRGYQAEHL